MTGRRALVPYLRPFPVWRRWEDPVGVWDWHPDWYGTKRFPTESAAQKWADSLSLEGKPGA
jgi:hypothetical protein